MRLALVTLALALPAPAGDLTLTVVNRVGNCIEPVTVREGYGAFGQGR